MATGRGWRSSLRYLLWALTGIGIVSTLHHLAWLSSHHQTSRYDGSNDEPLVQRQQQRIHHHDGKDDGTSSPFSTSQSIQILTNISKYDRYDGSDLHCQKGSTTTYYRPPELYWYSFSAEAGARTMTTVATTTTHAVTAANVVKQPIRRMLIVQSAGFGTYAQLLDLTTPLNKAYARKWGQDLVVVQGSLVWLAQERRTNCTPPEHRSTHNKMQFLKWGVSMLKDRYDYLLILDADAMIYDFDKDISDLMPPTNLMAANRVVAKKGVKKRATWKINAGVTLWNLHHPLTAAVADGWQKAAIGFMNGRNNNQGDQLFLYHVLRNNASMSDQVYSVGKEFNYNKATVIKHIKRPDLTYQIGKTALDSRSQVIQQFTKEICDKFPMDCQDLDQTNYSEL